MRCQGKLRIICLIPLLAATVFTTAVAREPVTLCIDKSYWYPFTFIKNNQPAGLFVDLAREIEQRANLDTVIRPTSWARCLRMAENGSIDGILGVAYKKERSNWLHFPTGAERTSTSSPFSISPVTYSVTTPASNPYAYNGEIKSLPAPVRVPRSYSIADDLVQQGADVKATFNSDKSALVDMIRMDTGSAILLDHLARRLKDQTFFKNKYTISQTPFTSKDYFLSFSKQSRLTPETRQYIWLTLKNIREDKSKMEHLYAKYYQAPAL